MQTIKKDKIKGLMIKSYLKELKTLKIKIERARTEFIKEDLKAKIKKIEDCLFILNISNNENI